MDGESTQDLVYQWLNKYYPEGPRWQEPHFDCYGDAPIEIKMVSAFDALEYNISNGGWAQVLWNCFGCWRHLLEIADEGYRLIGSLKQVEALVELARLCERDEDECRDFMRRADEEDDFSYFAEFTGRSYAAPGNDWQNLFYSDSGVYERRLDWLAQNDARIRKLVNYVPI